MKEEWNIMSMSGKSKKTNTKGPTCFTCGTKLIWQNDNCTEDVGLEDSEFMFISMYHCPKPKCEAWYEVYHDKKEEEKKY